MIAATAEEQFEKNCATEERRRECDEQNRIINEAVRRLGDKIDPMWLAAVLATEHEA